MFVLILPWILLLLFVLALVCLLRKKWILFLCIQIIALLLNNWAECIPLRLRKLSSKKNEKILRVMSFNIDGASEGIEYRSHKIVDLIKKTDPDIVFVAEYPEENIEVLDTLLRGCFDYTTCPGGCAHYFYSKYPLGEQQRFGDDIGVYKCIAHIDKDSIILYGCHFASNNYTADRKNITPDSIRNWDDVKTYLSDIQQAYGKRAYESQALVMNMKGEKAPIVVMGDYNDVGGSKTVKTLETVGLNDAWWKGGFGYGSTIHNPLPYRIDHIMYSKNLNLRSIEVIDSEGLSDHDALYAEFDY